MRQDESTWRPSLILNSAATRLIHPGSCPRWPSLTLDQHDDDDDDNDRSYLAIPFWLPPTSCGGPKPTMSRDQPVEGSPSRIGRVVWSTGARCLAGAPNVASPGSFFIFRRGEASQLESSRPRLLEVDGHDVSLPCWHCWPFGVISPDQTLLCSARVRIRVFSWPLSLLCSALLCSAHLLPVLPFAQRSLSMGPNRLQSSAYASWEACSAAAKLRVFSANSSRLSLSPRRRCSAQTGSHRHWHWPAPRDHRLLPRCQTSFGRVETGPPAQRQK